jgi:hypothetical protein
MVYLVVIALLVGVVIWNAPFIHDEFNDADRQIIGQPARFSEALLTEYSHPQLGIRLDYPSYWGSPVESRDDTEGLSEVYFENDSGSRSGVILSRQAFLQMPDCREVLAQQPEPGSDTYLSGCQTIDIGRRNNGRLLSVTDSMNQTFKEAYFSTPNGIWAVTPLSGTNEKELLALISTIDEIK